MLLHLPIAIMATFSPVAVSDTVPKYEIARACLRAGRSSDSTTLSPSASLEENQIFKSPSSTTIVDASFTA
jgi:hypothetical protein